MIIRLYVVLAILCCCPADLLDDDEYLDRTLHSAIRKSNLTLHGTCMKRFEPQGVTGIAVLGESHAAIHSWPQSGQLFIDIATCSSKESATVVFNEILAQFPGARVASHRELVVESDSET